MQNFVSDEFFNDVIINWEDKEVIPGGISKD